MADDGGRLVWVMTAAVLAAPSAAGMTWGREAPDGTLSSSCGDGAAEIAGSGNLGTQFPIRLNRLFALLRNPLNWADGRNLVVCPCQP